MLIASQVAVSIRTYIHISHDLCSVCHYFTYNRFHMHFIKAFFPRIDLLLEGNCEPKVTQTPSDSSKHVVFKGVHLLGPRPKQQWPLPSALTPTGS